MLPFKPFSFSGAWKPFFPCLIPHFGLFLLSPNYITWNFSKLYSSCYLWLQSCNFLRSFWSCTHKFSLDVFLSIFGPSVNIVTQLSAPMPSFIYFFFYTKNIIHANTELCEAPLITYFQDEYFPLSTVLIFLSLRKSFIHCNIFPWTLLLFFQFQYWCRMRDSQRLFWSLDLFSRSLSWIVLPFYHNKLETIYTWFSIS